MSARRQHGQEENVSKEAAGMMGKCQQEGSRTERKMSERRQQD